MKDINIKEIPLGPGIYKFSKNGVILYIGKAKNLQNRIKSYFNNKNNKVKRIINNSDKIEWILTKNENEALVLEAKLINKYKPRYNVKLKESKFFPRIAIDINSEYPRVFPYYGNNKENLLIFGPYPNIKTKTAIDVLTQTYPMRVCNDKIFARAKISKRACFLKDLGRCSGPCVGYIKKEEHLKIVNNVINFLNKERRTEIEAIEGKMYEHSNKEDYNFAIFYRNKINLLKSFINNSIDNINLPIDTDAFSIKILYGKTILGFAQFRDNELYSASYLVFDNGEEENKNKVYSEILSQFYLLYNSTSLPKEILFDNHHININTPILPNDISYINFPKGDNSLLLAIASRHMKEGENSGKYLSTDIYDNEHPAIIELKKILNSTNSIDRIEVYDNSHIQGRATIGGVVVYAEGSLQNKESRKIKLSVSNGDDYLSMREMAIKRFTKSKFGYKNLPDLIIIDGGKGQLTSFYNAYNSLNIEKNINIISIAKENEELFFLNKDKSYILKKGSQLYNFITMLRDKAHSNAISGHRKLILRENNFNTFPFLSKRQRESLFETFGDLNAIYQASHQDISNVKHIGPKTANLLIDYINKTS